MEETIMRWVFVGIVLIAAAFLLFLVSLIVLPVDRTYDCHKGEIQDRYNYGLFHFTVIGDMEVPTYIEQCRG